MYFFKKMFFFSCFFMFFGAFLLKSSVFFSFFDFYKEFPTLNDKNVAFKSGEKLKYKISYGKQGANQGLLLAAHATLSVQKTTLDMNRVVYKLSGFGKTTSFFSLFLKVKHSYVSFVDTINLKAIKSSMKIKEGKYYNSDTLIFSQETNINDMLGTFYKLRTVPQKDIIQQDTIFFSYYYNKNIYDSYFINHGQEFIDTKFGEMQTIKCEPLLERGRIFKENHGAFVWITDDNMHIPIKLEIPILIGSIYVNLVSYENTFFNLTN